ncbi:FAD synthase [Haloglomus salinum]|uniref:FAD synthase n=1 Tax=Haloglomus salinum TaxID=2962673 RepID=UPI0020C9901E|nr:FAD synthase [Haloglomus salinum]
MSGEERDIVDASQYERVVAQGTFDVLHPGHLHYLREAASLGDEVHVIIARSENVTHKEPPVLADQQRREMVDALDPVTEAHLGHLEDFFIPIERIDPDCILLGHDQHHDADGVRGALDGRGLDCDVRRASGREPRFEGELLSTGRIFDRICEERC